MNSVQQKSEQIINKIDYLFATLDSLYNQYNSVYGASDPNLALIEHKFIATQRAIESYLQYLKVITQLEMDGIITPNASNYTA